MSKISLKWFLALYAITLCALAPIRPMWLDEVLQLSDTYHNDLYQTTDRVAHNPGGVPLTYLAQNVFVNTFGHPFYSARALAVLWALAAMGGLVWLVRLLAIPWLPSALAYAMLPISLRYAVEVRQYGPGLAFAICATAFVIWLDRHPTTPRATLYALILTLGLYSHPYLAFVVLAHSVWAFRRSSAQYVLTACAASALIFLPWYVSVSDYWEKAVAEGGYQSSFSWKTALMIPHELSGGGYLLTCAFLALAIYGYRVTPIPPAAKQLLLLCILVPLPLVMAANLLFRYFFAIRQLVFIVPSLCIFATEGIRALPKMPRTAVSIALLCIALFHDFRWFHQS